VLRSQSVMHESDNEEDVDNEQELEENEGNKITILTP
jgi:hypothetical protein